jgi:choline dehydrogenase-like flavoprotein
MLIDGRSLCSSETLKTDICIIGAGPAGITLALEFKRLSLDVILLESGDREVSEDNQILQHLELLGLPYSQTARQRGFGGSSNRWNLKDGWRARPLDPIDFEARDSSYSKGWPFNREELDQFYERAHVVSGLGPYIYEPKQWHDPIEEDFFILNKENLRSGCFQRGPRHRFKEYWNRIVESSSTRLITNSTVTHLITQPESKAISKVSVTNFTKNSFFVEASTFILAAGGIENPRLLLSSNDVHTKGIGNDYDLVGRFFMEHPHIRTGYFYPYKRSLARRLNFYQYHQVKNVGLEGFLSLSEKMIRGENLPNMAFWLHQTSIKGTVRDLATAPFSFPDFRSINRYIENFKLRLAHTSDLLLQRGIKQSSANRIFSLEVESEQTPNWNSRVSLAKERDPLGMPMVQLDWRFNAGDLEAIRRTQELLDRELRREGIGWINCWYGDEYPPAKMGIGNHHMGTTRMNNDPKLGVVDENSKVHGIANLFVAGSSVFPSGGAANPTLTVLALSIRLADHISSILRA